jgi:hypothetical protein
VLLGPADERNTVQADEKFYHERPIEQRKRLLTEGNKMDPEKMRISFSVMIPRPGEDMQVEIGLNGIKFFANLQVFNELSKFAITGLERLSKRQQMQVQANKRE